MTEWVEIGDARLACGDCLEVMEEINSVDMILCDLPYGTTACKWDSVIPFDPLWKHYKRIISDTGSIVLFSSGQFTPSLMLSNPQMFKYKYVWVKRNSTNFVHAKNRPMTKHEDILIFSNAPMGHISQLSEKRMTYNPQGLEGINEYIKSGESRSGTVAGKRPSHKKTFERTHTGYPTDVLWQFDEVAAGKKLHTSEKPVSLLGYLIRTYTNENTVILDNCMGSGTTGVAAMQLGRKFIGIELDPKYFDIACKRIEDAQRQGILFQEPAKPKPKNLKLL